MTKLTKLPLTKIAQAKKLGARLVEDAEAVDIAMRKRDDTLYEFLGTLYLVDQQVREFDEGEAREAIKQEFGDKLAATKNLENLLLKLTYPDLSLKSRGTRSKYAKTLRYVLKKKCGSKSVKSFVRANGSINSCVAKERKLRKRKTR
jgi:hypothetical protein